MTHTTRAAIGATLLVLAGLSPGRADAQIPPVDEQIAGALLPLDGEQRAGATVMGYRVEGELTVLREGSGEMICLADAPGDQRFHVACYHESLEAFMARGRELTRQGIVDPERNQIRAAEAKAGTLKMPDIPARLSSLTGRASNWDPATGTLAAGSPLHVVYIPWKTSEETGLPTQPTSAGQPWIMFPGSYRAHIMIMPAPTGGGQ